MEPGSPEYLKGKQTALASYVLFCLPVRAQGTLSSGEMSCARPGPVTSARVGVSLHRGMLLAQPGPPGPLHRASLGQVSACHSCHCVLTACGGNCISHVPDCISSRGVRAGGVLRCVDDGSIHSACVL